MMTHTVQEILTDRSKGRDLTEGGGVCDQASDGVDVLARLIVRRGSAPASDVPGCKYLVRGELMSGSGLSCWFPWIFGKR